MNYPRLPLATHITLHEKEIDLSRLPNGLRVDEDLGLVTLPEVTGQVVYRAGR